jgi:pimeloyl-ACP methyl ester carboxylesterase
MSVLSPRIAAELAHGVYDVQSEILAGLFLKTRPEFADEGRHHKSISANLGWRLINVQDGFAICARGDGAYEKDLFLMFRGTTKAHHYIDWLSNVRVGVEFSTTGCLVHLGFNQVFRSLEMQLKDFLAKSAKGVTTIHCIGHSLGGAVATLAADWVKAKTGKAVRLYTFGAPRPGMGSFSVDLTRRLGRKNIYRVYHTTDPVPMVPVFPFIHPPISDWGYHVPSTDSLLSAEAHAREKYMESTKGLGWQNLKGRAPLSASEKVVERWLMSDQSLNPFSPKTWDWLNAAMMLVIKKILHGSAVVIQGVFTSAFTIADKLAWLIRKGIDLSKSIARWVLQLVKKITLALGMVVDVTLETLTQRFLRGVLHRLMERMGAEAARAIRQIVS